MKKPLPFNSIRAKIDAGKEYGDLTPKEKRIIRNRLQESQKFLCCYCEKTIEKNDVHIEHFFEQYHEKGKNRSLDYEHNLLASCTKNPRPKDEKETKDEQEKRLEALSCGHKKSISQHKAKTVDYSLLLNPMDGVAHLFAYYYDGAAAPSSDCSEEEKRQVEYTIERLNLNSKELIRDRKKAIEALRDSISGLPDTELKKIVADVLSETDDDGKPKERLDPFYSTLKDNFAFILGN